MTKLIDLNGAREALPITHHDFKGEGWFCNNDLSNVHLEVDVEAMGKIINAIRFLHPDATGKLIADTLKYNTNQWARLVRR